MVQWIGERLHPKNRSKPLARVALRRHPLGALCPFIFLLNSGTATISPEARSAQSRSRQDIGSVFGLSRSGVMSMVGGA